MSPYSLLPVLATMLLLSGCEKKVNEPLSAEVEYIKYGTSFGECLGYCRNELTLYGNTINLQKSGWNLEGALPGILLTDNIDDRYPKAILDQLNLQEFFSLDSVTGCPDCADGGAEWIEIKGKGKTYKVIFEYQNEPEALSDYIHYLRTYLLAFPADNSQDVDFNGRVLIDQQGTIKKFIGAFHEYPAQYVIQVVDHRDTLYYYDAGLDSSFKTDNLDVVFNGALQDGSTLIYTSQAQEMPEADLMARNIITVGLVAD